MILFIWGDPLEPISILGAGYVDIVQGRGRDDCTLTVGQSMIAAGVFHKHAPGRGRPVSCYNQESGAAR